MRISRLLLVTAVSALALGCGDAPDAGRGAAPPPAIPPAPPAVSDTSALRALALTLEAPDTVAAGDSVLFRLRFENRGDVWVALRMSAPVPEFDVRVAEADGDTVWAWLWGKGVPQGGQEVTLGPGGVIEMRAVWNQRDLRGLPLPKGIPPPPGSYERDRGWLAPPGRYTVTAELRFGLGDTGQTLRAGPRTLIIRPR